MDDWSVIAEAFPDLTENQQKQFEQMGALYRFWNNRINLISRKDIKNLYTHHILHSLAIAKVIIWKPNTKILDVGTGGGFPGIPLAVLFPDVQFTLVDSIRKKIQVVREIAHELKLKNIEVIHTRAEDLNDQFDFIVARAVANADTLFKWTAKLIVSSQKNVLPNGWLLLKGGNVEIEMNQLNRDFEVTPISNLFSHEYYLEKYVIYVQK